MHMDRSITSGKEALLGRRVTLTCGHDINFELQAIFLHVWELCHFIVLQKVHEEMFYFFSQFYKPPS